MYPAVSCSFLPLFVCLFVSLFIIILLLLLLHWKQVIRLPETSDETFDTLFQFSKDLGKVPVSCKVCSIASLQMQLTLPGHEPSSWQRETGYTQSRKRQLYFVVYWIAQSLFPSLNLSSLCFHSIFLFSPFSFLLSFVFTHFHTYPFKIYNIPCNILLSSLALISSCLFVFCSFSLLFALDTKLAGHPRFYCESLVSAVHDGGL